MADVPRLSAAEWALLKHGLMALPPDHLAAIRRKISKMALDGERINRTLAGGPLRSSKSARSYPNGMTAYSFHQLTLSAIRRHSG